MFPKSFEITYLPSYIVGGVGIVANVMLLIAFIKDPLKCFRNSATYLFGNFTVRLDVLFGDDGKHRQKSE